MVSRKDGSMTDHLQFRKYVTLGLLTFDHLGDKQNGIPLFSNISQLKDYDNRLDVARRLGYVPPRIVPTPQMFADYLKDGEIISPDAKGGSYWRYTLRDFFPVHADKSFIPGLGPFEEPGVWCGAPMTALRRAFQVISDPTIEGIPEEQLEQLWQMRKLYARRIPRIDPLASPTSTSSGQDTGRIMVSGTKEVAQAPATAPATSAATQPSTAAVSWLGPHPESPISNMM
ncbi:hypothetical protein RBB50_012469 [Rhinocladiella similis]